jgi:hypothetical protein
MLRSHGCEVEAGLAAIDGHGGFVVVHTHVGAQLDHETGLTDHDLVAVLQAGLVALLPVDERARGRPEVDDVDLVEARHFDHGVHARG